MEICELSESRALSAAYARWQSVRCRWLGAAALIAATVAVPSLSWAVEVQTLPLGSYSCELPGDAMHAAGLHIPAEDFAIVHSSTYAAAGKMGSYLMIGGIIEMTSGPRAGEKFHRISDNFLRKLDPTGHDGELRCIRQITNDRQ